MHVELCCVLEATWQFPNRLQSNHNHRDIENTLKRLACPHHSYVMAFIEVIKMQSLYGVIKLSHYIDNVPVEFLWELRGT